MDRPDRFAVEILPMAPGHPRWEETRRFARQSSWRAGPYLAREMGKGAFTDWERVFSLWVDGQITGYCTFVRTDELPPEEGFSPFIGFVFVDEAHRGHRLSQRMLDAVLDYAGQVGFEKVYLMSSEAGLYEKYGFQKLGVYRTVFDTMDQLFYKRTPRHSTEAQEELS